MYVLNMKKLLSRLCLLVLALLLVLACDPTSDPDPEQEVTREELLQMQTSEYTVGETEHLTPEQWADFVFGERQLMGVGDSLSAADKAAAEAREAFLRRCHEKEDSLANELGENAFTLIFGRKNFNYQSIDEHGDPITLSAFLGWGEYWVPFKYYPLDQDGIRLVCPYTHTKEDECATADGGGYEFTTQTGDYLFIMPDGEGFGVNKGHDQLYLNHKVQARQIFDALAAGYNIYVNDIKGCFEDGWTLCVYGASQGAADAIAVQRYLENEGIPFGTSVFPYALIYGFDYSFVCCGPYSPVATLEEYYRQGKVYYPLVLPLTIKSMRTSYPELAQNYAEERFYSDKYVASLSLWDDIITGKKLTADDLNAKLLKSLQTDDEKKKGETFLRLERILSAEVLDTTTQIYKDFMECLLEQDLTTGWTPHQKAHIYYSKKDEVVPYVNSQKLMQLFGSKAEKEEAFWDGHVACCTQFMLKSW